MILRYDPLCRRGPDHQAKWLWTTLRAAELAGLDARQVLASAIGERILELTADRDRDMEAAD